MQNVLPKLRKWHAEMDEQHSAVESIRLVSLEAYNNLYQDLKKKYVPNITKVLFNVLYYFLTLTVHKLDLGLA